MRAPSERKVLTCPPGRYYFGHGLVLIVRSKTRRSWSFRYIKPSTRRPTETSIGSAYSFTYHDARNEIWKMRQWLDKRQDPVQEKRKQRAAGKTFAEVCEEWINHHRSRWRSLRHVKILLGKHCQKLADVPVHMIDKPMIIDTFSDLYKRFPGQALRAIGMCRDVLEFAIAKDIRPEPNPANRLEHIFLKHENHSKLYPHLPPSEVPGLYSRLCLREGDTAIALRFLILTATRPSETCEMRWSEINWETRIWTLPPERTKQDRQHRVPLSAKCMEILTLQKKLQNEYQIASDFVFTGYQGEALDRNAMRKLLERMDLPEHVVPSGFRKSFRNWVQRTYFGNPLIDSDRRDLGEMCVGHLIKGEIEGRYWTEDAIDERRAIMDAWADYCSSNSYNS
jgi:integrase